MPRANYRRRRIPPDDVPDVASHVVALGDDVVAGHGRPAARRLGERAEHVDGGRLPRAVWPEEAEDLARWHRELDAPDRLHVAEVLDQVVDGDRGTAG